MTKNDQTYISIDIETAGPNPSTYSLLSIGACNVIDLSNTFYIELKPVNDNIITAALEISGLEWTDLVNSGIPPREAMSQFADWVNQFIKTGSQPIFVAFNAPFDWMFVNDYFHRYLNHNPFGHKALDIKAFFMGMVGVSWDETGMRQVSRRYLADIRLSHHALQDALDQARIFQRMLAEFEK